MFAAKQPEPMPKSDEWRLVPTQPRHPVTAAMWKQAHTAQGMLAPDFTVIDTDGTQRSLDDLTKSGPLFIYFVLDGCPCSLEAEPHYEDLAMQFHGAVSFLAVTNSDEQSATKWKREFAVPFPVVAQPQLELMNKFAVQRAVYCLLIGKDKKIISMWPGYSASMLQAVNKEMANATGLPVKPFDSKLAPEIMTSGCAFTTKA